MTRTTWLTLPALILLGLVVLHGTGEALRSRMLTYAEGVWPDYASLRVETSRPTCDTVSTENRESDEATDDDLLNDLLDEEDDAPVSAEALEAAQAACTKDVAAFNARQQRMTTGLRAFVGMERTVGAFVGAGMTYLRHVLVLLLLICATIATARRGHIALQSATDLYEDRFAEGGQLVANALLLISSFYKWRMDETSSAQVDNAALPIMWILGFVVLIALNVWHLLRPEGHYHRPDTFSFKGLLAIPLYATMGIISGIYFFGVEGHKAGLGIHLQKVTEHALIYLHVGLYVWAGMLLKRTRLVGLFFDVLRPWKMPAELLAFVVVVAAAIPTAYSGASGIFVIAAGAVIYQELRKAGARKQLALAATAMSGSLGVVLSPCLLVVIVASLNKQVTTDQLYAWGWKVYALTALLFLVAATVVSKEKWNVAPWSQAKPDLKRAVLALLPYVGVLGLILAVYYFGLATTLSEHSAPVMLPAVLLVLLVYDRRRIAQAARVDASLTSESHGSAEDTGSERISSPDGAGTIASVAPQGGLRKTAHIGTALLDATRETTHHIGALLMLMTLSVCLGGVVERSEMMSAVPESFGSVYLTMLVLVVVLVIIGMIMDPYGAVILVTAAVADIAYRNGIDPVHFWMVVLVAFELGYLSPPVALNHLLTRQVVGANECSEDDNAEGVGYYAQHERVLLPLAVMVVALMLVAFVPLLF